ncbi:hypothetical protein CW304_01475 [Bacillus sp. UFRGS-B20]|nr:hypothetical protein CW304_01475 [Bacillus sp. UFRGS-B20]
MDNSSCTQVNPTETSVKILLKVQWLYPDTLFYWIIFISNYLAFISKYHLLDASTDRYLPYKHFVNADNPYTLRCENSWNLTLIICFRRSTFE